MPDLIKWDVTNRGFARGEFRDRYGRECSIQASSIATEDCIWLGCDHETRDAEGKPCGARMHVSQELAGELAQILLRFSYTSILSED